jgi:transcription elongation GreA/GreB family factor
MTPEERLKQKAKNLIQTGCTPVDAVVQASKEFGDLANQADTLQNVKEQIEWDLKFGK